MFCDKCQSIFKGPGVDNDELYNMRCLCGIHHKDMNSLIRSSMQSCQICRPMLEDIKQQQLGIDMIKFEVYRNPGHRLWLYLRPESKSIPTALYFSFKLYELSHDYPLLKACDITSLSTASDASLKIATEWLEKCDKGDRGHEICRKAQSSDWYPSRLLDIGKTQNDLVYLRSSKEIYRNGEYIALSHCWGTVPMKLKLTAGTRKLLAQGFSKQDLPTLFKDVVDVAHRLRIQYLWIDSLCILQDSPQDWENEAAQMASVYYHSYCTIAATQAANSAESLFSTRVENCINIKTAWTSYENTEYRIVPYDFWNSELHSSIAPLNKRAWAFQERFLSRRIIHFGKNQLLWECKCLSSSELWPSGIPMDLCDGAEEKARRDIWDQVDSWKGIVERYSRCDLTKESDRLIAIAGVANVLDANFKGSYVSGIWTQHASKLLAWVSAEELRVQKTPIQRINNDEVPNWSWLSFNGPVKFPLRSPDDVNHESCITVLDYSTFENTKRNFIRIQGKALRLQVHLCPIHLCNFTFIIATNGFMECSLYFEPILPNSATTNQIKCEVAAVVSFDTVLDDLDWDGFFLPLEHGESRSPPICGILVKQAVYERRTCYERCGYLRTSLLPATETVSHGMPPSWARITHFSMSEPSKPLSISPEHMLGSNHDRQVEVELI